MVLYERKYKVTYTSYLEYGIRTNMMIVHGVRPKILCSLTEQHTEIYTFMSVASGVFVSMQRARDMINFTADKFGLLLLFQKQRQNGHQLRVFFFISSSGKGAKIWVVNLMCVCMLSYTGYIYVRNAEKTMDNNGQATFCMLLLCYCYSRSGCCAVALLLLNVFRVLRPNGQK